MSSHRFVLDDACFKLHGLSHQDIRLNLLSLLDELGSLRNCGEAVAVIQSWGGIECMPGIDLATLLTAHDHLDRDEGTLLLGLLGKCSLWDESPTVVVSPEVLISGTPNESFGSAYALGEVCQRRALAVVTTPHRTHRGVCLVEQEPLSAHVYFVVTPSDHLAFYRSIFELEDVSEVGFFELGEKAFPDLIFADGLSFGHFTGAYRNVRAAVVVNLAALNDGFIISYRAGAANIAAQLQIDVSIEGGRTRSSEALMRLRDVMHEGRAYRCEWHAKLEPHRNRIHFCPNADGTILIGLFVDHLDT